MVLALSREAPNAVGNRQADDDHVYRQPQDQIAKLVRTPGVKRRDRQDDEIHYLFDRSAEEQATDQRILFQEWKLQTCPVINGSRRACDEEVQQDTENISGCASMQRLPSQQPGSDRQRDIPSKEDAGLCQV